MTAPPVPAARCPSCGEGLQGVYCHRCGEKQLDARDRTVAHFVQDAVGTLTNVDGTLWRSFRLLILHPGALTAAYLRGVRKPYLTPFRIFLLCNLVYFFVQPYTGFTGFNTTLASQRDRQVYSSLLDIDGRVRAVLQADVLAPEVYAERYRRYEEHFDARSSTYARTFIFLLIPLYALALKAVLPRRLYADHVVFAAHLLAWQLLVVMSAFLLLYRHLLMGLVYDLLPGPLAGFISESISSVLVAGYVYLALRQAYAASRRSALWRAWALSLGVVIVPGIFLIATLLYRLGLFWLTFITTPVPGG